VNIKVTAVFPPIPTTNFDYCAVDDDTYDASYEGEDENGSHWKVSPSGSGATELDAVLSLLDSLDVCAACCDAVKDLWPDLEAVNECVARCLDAQCGAPEPQTENYWGIERDV